MYLFQNFAQDYLATRDTWRGNLQSTTNCAGIQPKPLNCWWQHTEALGREPQYMEDIHTRSERTPLRPTTKQQNDDNNNVIV